MLHHRLQQLDGAGEIVVVIAQRDLDGLSHGLQAGEMDDRIEVLLGEDPVDRAPIEEVAMVKLELAPGDPLDAPKRLSRAVVEIVDDGHVVSGAEQLDARMAAYETGAARDQHLRAHGGKG